MSRQESGTRTPEERRRDIRDGVRNGLLYAGGFSVLAVVWVGIAALISLSHRHLGEATRILLIALPFYFLTGTVGGALFGFMRPLRKRKWGRLLTAYILYLFVYWSGLLVLAPTFDASPRILLYTGALFAVAGLFFAPLLVSMFKDETG